MTEELSSRDSMDPSGGFGRALLLWYDQHRRELPWRVDRDPYRILVSEVMLQQTRVETVLPYYQAFLERFPTVEELAAAPIDAVLARWSGLGYYLRARRLHGAAAAVVARGGWPKTATELLELPGIGPYTAAAVASIAFGEWIPVVDGNVERVLSRLDASPLDPKSARGRRRLADRAGELLDPDRPGDANQALMELGATVCRPRRPDCSVCPVVSWCEARSEGNPERYPVRGEGTARSVHIERTVVIVQEDECILLFRRPDDEEMLAGTWELPHWDGQGEAAAGLAARYGGHWRLGPERGELRHSITHRRLLVRVREGSWSSGGASVQEAPEAGWFDRDERGELGVSSLVKKSLRLAGVDGQ